MGGLVVSALVNAGVSFFAPATGASQRRRFEAAGITLGLTVGSYLLQKLLGEDETNAAAEQKKSEREIRSSVVPARYVVGTCKVSGALIKYLEKYYDPAEPTENPDDGLISLKQAIQYKAYAISELGIHDILEVYVDGRKMPFDLSNDIITPDPTAFDIRIAEIESEQDTLNVGPGIIQLNNANNIRWEELEREKKELVKDRDEGKWVYDPGAGLLNPFGKTLDNVRISIDRNTSGVSAADTRSGQIITDPGWGLASNLQGLSWAFIELRAIEPIIEENLIKTVSPDWSGNNPEVQFVLQGAINGKYTENPAEIARWYLQDICGFKDDDLDLTSYASAFSICDQDVIINPVTLSSSSSELDPVLKSLFPGAVDNNGDIDPSLLPSASEQTKALSNWNRRFAGASNSEKRYQCHGVITSNMLLNPGVLLQQLGTAMGGWIVSVGSKFKFVAGHATTPTRTITQDDLASVITENLGPLYDRRFNAIKASISQLKTEDYTSYSIGSIIDPSLVKSDGYREENLGTLPFQNSEIAARRLLAKYRRRNHPDLRRLGFSITPGTNFENYNITAGDRITLDFPSEGVNSVTFRVVSVVLNPNGTINLETIEEPDDVWSDTFDPELEILLGERTSESIINTGTPFRDLNNTIVFDSITKELVTYDYTERIGGVSRSATEILLSVVINDLRVMSNDNTAKLVYKLDADDWALVEKQDYDPDNYAPVFSQDMDTEYFTASLPESPETRYLTLAVRTGADPEMGEDPDYEYHDITPFAVGSDASEVYSVIVDDVAPTTLDIFGSTIEIIRILNARATMNATLVYKFDGSDYEEVVASVSTDDLSSIIIEDGDEDGYFNIGIVRSRNITFESSNIILAARIGAGTTEEPYEYFGIVFIPVSEDVLPQFVEEEPTDSFIAPFPERTIFWMPEEE